MGEKKNIPELRFPKFQGKWENYPLKAISRINPAAIPLPDSFIYIDLESVQKGRLEKEERVLRNDAPSRAQRTIRSGDILYQTVRPYQMNNYFFNKKSKDYVASTGYAQIRSKENPQYIYQYLHTSRFVGKVLARCTGTSYPAINSTDLGSIKIGVPEAEEQQKIAEFLSAVDKKLDLLQKKKQGLEQYKKGVMQKIFSQELRFKDAKGREFPEWKRKKLKQVFKRRIKKNTSNEINLVLTNSAIQGVVAQTDFFDHQVANKNNLTGYYIVEKDDFVYNPRTSNPAPVGPINRNKLETGIMSPLYTILNPKKGNSDFFEFYFKTSFWHKYMKSVANYGARHDRINVTNDDLLNMPVPFPDLEEQTKIASFLSAIDKKITAVENQLQGTREFKKGLLQKMFV